MNTEYTLVYTQDGNQNILFLFIISTSILLRSSIWRPHWFTIILKGISDFCLIIPVFLTQAGLFYVHVKWALSAFLMCVKLSLKLGFKLMKSDFICMLISPLCKEMNELINTNLCSAIYQVWTFSGNSFCHSRPVYFCGASCDICFVKDRWIKQENILYRK